MIFSSQKHAVEAHASCHFGSSFHKRTSTVWSYIPCFQGFVLALLCRSNGLKDFCSYPQVLFLKCISLFFSPHLRCLRHCIPKTLFSEYCSFAHLAVVLCLLLLLSEFETSYLLIQGWYMTSASAKPPWRICCWFAVYDFLFSPLFLKSMNWSEMHEINKRKKKNFDTILMIHTKFDTLINWGKILTMTVTDIRSHTVICGHTYRKVAK